MHRIFVYGTLKRGYPNYPLLENTENGIANFVSDGVTAEKYPLVIATKFGIPCLLNSPSVGENVRGEIWEVDDSMLEKLDELELHPSWYTRTEIEVHISKEEVEEKETSKCSVYLMYDFDPKLIHYKHLSNYTNPGSTYIRSSGRDDFDPYETKKK